MMDIDFINKRIAEQDEYIEKILNGEIKTNRIPELIESARQVKEYFVNKRYETTIPITDKEYSKLMKYLR